MKTETLRPLDSIESALADLKSGKMIIVVDDENRENEGDFIMAADAITPEAINFMATVGRGLICTPLSAEKARHFGLPLQVRTSGESHGTAFTVTIDARDNISTGISSADRAHTIKLLTRETTSASDFVRPGHIFPLIAKNGGVLERPGHTEASVDLSRLSGFSPVGVICEIMNPDGTMARLPELIKLADQHNLRIISIEDLIQYRRTHDELISSVESIPFPNKFGDFTLYVFRSETLKEEHIALVKGNLERLKTPDTAVRVHSECLTGDLFGSLRCDCGEQFNAAMKELEHRGSGVLLYLRQEGRGIGLFNKVKAYQLQDQGLDTAEANLHLGFKVDARDYTMAAQILRYFGMTSVELMTNNPSKIDALHRLGVENISRCSLEINPNYKNAQYLLTKKSKLGHLLENL